MNEFEKGVVSLFAVTSLLLVMGFTLVFGIQWWSYVGGVFSLIPAFVVYSCGKTDLKQRKGENK